MAKNLRLVDGNSVGRAAHAGRVLSAGGMQTQAIFNFIKGARNWIMEAPDFTPLILWDGRAQWRFDLYPEYKGKRDDSPEKIAVSEAYKQQKPYIIKMLQSLGVRQVMAKHEEADDLAGMFVRGRLASHPGSQIKLTTGDEDWAQLIRPGVEWEDHRERSKFFNLENLFDKTGYRTPYAFLEGKALQGDSSDNISGVGGIGEKKAPEILAEFGSVREFWRKVDTGEFKPKYAIHKRLASAEGRAIFGRNIRLMQLIKPREIPAGSTVVYRGEYDREKFLDMCSSLAFMSIIRDKASFLAPFEKHCGAK